jgi:hypothetical protein
MVCGDYMVATGDRNVAADGTFRDRFDFVRTLRSSALDADSRLKSEAETRSSPRDQMPLRLRRARLIHVSKVSRLP